MSLQTLPKSFPRTLGLMMGTATFTGAITLYGVSQVRQPPASPDPVPIVAAPRSITALGRLEPATEVIQVSAPLSLSGDRVAVLQVNRGDRVAQGDVIAVLDSRDRLQDAVHQAQEQVNVARAKLAQVQAGAKTGEIAAQDAEIARLKAQLQGEIASQSATISRWRSEVSIAQAEFDRFQALYQQGAISTSALDQKRLALETAQAQLDETLANQNRTIETVRAQIQEAQATRNQIAEVRPVDVQAAQTEVDAAIATLQQAQTDLAQAYIRAPITGQILEIHTRPGETIRPEGVVAMGQTNQMDVVAEVYQTDIEQIQVGQRAIVTSEAFPAALEGEVSEVGLQVLQQNVYSNQPGENLDRRVVEVRIRLRPAASPQVAGLTNLQVQVAIQP